MSGSAAAQGALYTEATRREQRQTTELHPDDAPVEGDR
jgi:hypothetical protein